MKKNNIIAGYLFLLFILLFTSCTTMQNQSYNYGEKVQYGENQVLNFPDFSVRFMGERKVKVPQYAPGYFLNYDFEIFSDTEKKVVSWSSGTGDIGPESFKFNNSDYVLEKGSSIVSGRLAENEIVLWSQDQYKIELEKTQVK